MNKWVWIGGGVAVLIALLAWLFIESSKPLPGEKQGYNCDDYIDFSKLENADTSDKCRVHVPVGTEVKYPTNPPTQGPHYAEWVRVGVYEGEKDDRNMVHSLEHGYVIMSYKCVIASEAKQSGSEEIASSSSTKVGTPRNDEECEVRKNQLAKIYEKKGKKKLIVVPKSNLDTNFALTAWSYLDKFDNFDEDRINKFIDAHRDMGPEKTMD